MLRMVLLLVLLSVTSAWGQSVGPLVTAAHLDAAVEQASISLPPEDPSRANLLRLYGDARTLLAELEQHQSALKQYSQARAQAADQAQLIKAALAERDVAGDLFTVPLASGTLQDLEQALQVYRSELEARQGSLSELGDLVAAAPARSLEIRNRLTELGGEIPRLTSALALMPANAESGSEVEAELWLARLKLAVAAAEKAALDEELLSQPARLELLKAQRDQAGQDVAALGRRLQSMERQAGEMRKTGAVKAREEAEIAVARTVGKHLLLRQLADKNANLTTSFEERSKAIQAAQEREARLSREALRLVTDLQGIGHKLNLLGMNVAVGQILREQQVQLPNRRESKKEIASVGDSITASNLRQLELEDERRNLREAKRFVDRMVAEGKDEVTAEEYDGLVALARTRRQLVDQAIELENTYASALGNLDFSLRKYATVAADYRQFISERLLWIPSRDSFSVFREGALISQLAEMFAPARWARVLRQVPGEVKAQPVLGLAVFLVLILFFYAARLTAALIARGREVGYVRSDRFSDTIKALGLSLLLSFKWPSLMLTLALLFEMQEVESELATALYAAMLRGSLYLWGLEFMRVLLIPKGLVDAHFRWPPARISAMHRRVLRLEQSLFPAVLLVIFCVQLYPRELGGALGTIAMIVVLLSLAQFFRKLPHFFRGKMEMMIVADPGKQTSTLAGLVRQLLVWGPLLGIVAVGFGYIYTSIELCLLLIKTIVLACLMLLFHELGIRWLRMTRRRMVVKARADLAQGAGEEGEEDDFLENDPELLNDEGIKLLNVLTLFGSLVGVALVWAGVFPALGILDSVELWHQMGVVDGREVPVPVTLANIAWALVVAVLGWVAMRRIPGLLEILLRQKVGVRPASAYAATRVFLYAGTAALVVTVLSSLGGSWSQIQWAVAALSVGIGFGLQEIVANFISGLIILFEQPVRVGDTVTVGNVSGRVTKIRIRATTIRDFDNRELLVPNKEFITQQLLNWSLSDQVTRWVMEVGVAYGTDLDKAMGIVMDAAQQHPLVLKEPEPLVTFEQFGDNSLLIKLRFFMDQLDQRLRVSSAVMLEINRRFIEQGIEVSFPQRDVHLDTSEPLEIRWVDRPPAGQGPATGSV